MRAGSRARRTSRPAPRSRWRGADISSCSRSSGTGRAYAHIRTTCALALIGLVGFWIDTTARHDDGAHPMRRRILVILVALIAATIYFRLRPGV